MPVAQSHRSKSLVISRTEHRQTFSSDLSGLYRTPSAVVGQHPPLARQLSVLTFAQSPSSSSPSPSVSSTFRSLPSPPRLTSMSTRAFPPLPLSLHRSTPVPQPSFHALDLHRCTLSSPARDLLLSSFSPLLDQSILSPIVTSPVPLMIGLNHLLLLLPLVYHLPSSFPFRSASTSPSSFPPPSFPPPFSC